MTAAIELREVSVRLAGAAALERVSLAVEEGETLALLGPSGSGKTTLLRLLLGFLAPERGAVVVGGDEVARDGRILVPPEERDLAVVFQDLALWPHLRVRGNLEFGLKSRRVPKAERERRIREVLASVGLLGKEQRYPDTLSGGERQRVAIARALVLEPRAILLDEPLSSLDVALKEELTAVFRSLFGARRLTAVHVTHDLREARALARRAAVLEGGKLVQAGTIGDLEARPASGFVEALLRDLHGPGGGGA